MKKVLLVVYFFLLSPLFFALPAYSIETKISTTFENGKRSATDYLDDRDLSSNLNVYRQQLRLDQKLSSDTKYSVSYERYYKDYDALDSLDSVSDQWLAGFNHSFNDVAVNPLKLDIDAGLKYKDYKNSPDSDYTRSNAAAGLSYGEEDLWNIKWSNGLINYAFDSADKDELKLFTQVSGWTKLMGGRLKISPSYKFQAVEEDKNGTNRNENTIKLAAVCQLLPSYFKAVGAFYELGKNDTKDSEDEDRDDNLRYKYTRWYITTEHPLTKNFETDFKYGRGIRNYSDSNNDYKNWFIEDKSIWNVYEDEVKKIDLLITVEHREGDYDQVDSLNYIKDVINVKVVDRIKRDWELIPGFTFKKYNYHASPLKKENDYETKVEFTKELLNEKLEFKISYKYCLKDYRNKPDITLWQVRSGLEYKF